MGELFDTIQQKLQTGGTKTAGEPPLDTKLQSELATYRHEKIKNKLTNEFMAEEKPDATAVRAITDMATTREKSQGDMITMLLGKLIDSKGQHPNIAEDPYVRKLEQELQEIKQGQQNPFETWSQVQTALANFATSMGLTKPSPPAPQVTNESIQLQLEQLKLETEERRQQWKMEMEQRQHQWEEQKRQWDVEDRRWGEEFKLKKIELFDKQKKDEDRGGMFADLLGALSNNITIARTGATESVAANPNPAKEPMGFTCDECNQFIPVTDPNLGSVTCRTCGTEYNLTKKEANP